MPNQSSLAGIILTHNEEHNVGGCIDTLGWVDEVLVFDSFSKDNTLEVAKDAGARVVQHVFENYGSQRDAALNSVKTDWVFFVDADERVSPELAAEVRAKLPLPQRGWWVPRHNYIFGRLTLGAGWFPDYQLRVLHHASAHYDPLRPVHETVILEGEAGYLVHPLIHHNYRDVAHFLDKQEHYADIEARLRLEQGMRPRTRTYLGGPAREFYRRFISLKGYRDGLHGLRLSALMAYYELQTWRRVARLAQGTER